MWNKTSSPKYLRGKEGQSLAPVFTPLLGPLDEASKAVMLKYIGPKIPDQKEAQEKFFAPDITALPKKEAENYLRRGKDLKRTLVDHNGMSPIGLLRWCLQHARESVTPVGGVFAEVKACFSSLSDGDYKLVSRINTFRNDYIAHQNKELTDAAIAAKALGEWVSGLCKIWRFYG